MIAPRRRLTHAGGSWQTRRVKAAKRSRARSHVSFRREAAFHAVPHPLDAVILDAERDVPVRRSDIDPRCYVLGSLMSRRECKRLIAAAEAVGFTHAGLAVGDDTYRVN